VFRSRGFRAGLFLLIIVALLLSGGGHVVFHGDHAHDGHADLHGSDSAHCVACHLQLVDFDLCLMVPAASQRSVALVELGPESLHAASERGRAAPRAPPAAV
jgi:hypothetical protein